MHAAHSTRDSAGQVHLGWLPKAALDRVGQLLGLHQLKLRGLYPAPYQCLKKLQGQVSTCVVDGQLLLRFTQAHAAVEPLAEDRLQALAAAGETLLWPVDQQCWSGATPGWSLHAGIGKGAGTGSRLGQAAACCAPAVGVWVVGLNLTPPVKSPRGNSSNSR